MMQRMFHLLRNQIYYHIPNLEKSFQYHQQLRVNGPADSNNYINQAINNPIKEKEKDLLDMECEN